MTDDTKRLSLPVTNVTTCGVKVTERNLEVLRCFSEGNPTAREVGASLGMKSSHAIFCHIRRLVSLGLLASAEGKSRSYRLTAAGNERLGIVEPRAIIKAFAVEMELKLRENDKTKPPWTNAEKLLLHVDEEVDELKDAFVRLRGSRGSISEKERLGRDVVREAADLANVSMMVADILVGFGKHDGRGR